ncbi:restriction endonuclease [Halomarina ordinaria]|uniref:Restriction endonuclease n=1 Tax=Halomarina ordinaria TaxID=3033939 RepID=A0ABD5UC05_9EURY|nr:restriction endonuclease [Halomarina sp. PSRA2]
MKDTHDIGALQRLDPERFAGLVREFADARWEDWTVEVAPPTPAGAIDVHLEREGRRHLLHVRHYPETSRVDVRVVRDLVAVGTERGFDAVTLATTSAFTPEAASRATEADVETLDGEALARAFDEAGVEFPEGDGAELASSLRTLDYWPEPLVERIEAVIALLDEAAPDDQHRTRTSTYTDVDYYREDVEGLFAKARVTGHSFLAYVRVDGRLQPVVRLSVHESPERSLDAERELSAAIRRALSH